MSAITPSGRPVVDLSGPHLQRGTRRAVEIERALVGPLCQAPSSSSVTACAASVSPWRLTMSVLARELR